MDHKEFLKRFRQSGREELAAQITPDTVNDELRTVDIVWFTGVDVDRYDWWTDTSYTLRFEPKGADLSMLNRRAPLCNSHGTHDINDQLGVVLKAWQSNGQYMATVQFKRSTELTGPRPLVDGLWQDVKDGVVSKFSMGVELLESVDTKGKDDRLELRTVTKWQPYEISVCSVPADMGTTTLTSVIKRPDLSHLAARRRREIEILALR